MPTVRRNEEGDPVVERTVAEERRAEARRQAHSLCAALTGDGPEARKVLDEIRTCLRSVGDEGCADLLGGWRRQVRAARYQDWLASRGSAA